MKMRRHEVQEAREGKVPGREGKRSEEKGRKLKEKERGPGPGRPRPPQAVPGRPRPPQVEGRTIGLTHCSFLRSALKAQNLG